MISDLAIKDDEYPLPDELQRTNAYKNLALFGTAYAVWVVNATLSMFDIEKDRPHIGGTLVAAPIGFFAALNLSKNTHFSVGRTRMISSTVVWATYWGITSMAVLNPEDTSPYLAFSLATGGIGLYGSVKYTSTHEISTSRVNFINIGAFLGSLFGLGVPYLADAQGDADDENKNREQSHPDADVEVDVPLNAVHDKGGRRVRQKKQANDGNPKDAPGDGVAAPPVGQPPAPSADHARRQCD